MALKSRHPYLPVMRGLIQIERATAVTRGYGSRKNIFNDMRVMFGRVGKKNKLSFISYIIVFRRKRHKLQHSHWNAILSPTFCHEHVEMHLLFLRRQTLGYTWHAVVFCSQSICFLCLWSAAFFSNWPAESGRIVYWAAKLPMQCVFLKSDNFQQDRMVLWKEK